VGKLGTTNYLRNQYKKRNYWKLEEGESIYRIIPPYASLAENGRWSYFWRIHFGFAGTDGRMKPVACIQAKDRNEMVTQSCPICEFQTQLKLKERELKERGENELTLKPIRERIRAVDPDSKHYINTMTLDGQLGVLKIPSRAMKALLSRIDKLRAEGIDPVNPEGGVFFVFRRTGMGLDTLHEVDVYTETVTVNGEKYNRIKPAPLTEAVVNRITSDPSEVFDLPTMYKRLTAEELGMLVNGDASVVDRLFSRPEIAGGNGKTTGATVPEKVAGGYALPSNPGPLPKVISEAPPVMATQIQTPVVAAAPVQATPVAQTKATPNAVDVTSMSDEEFERLFQTSISTNGK